SYVLGELAEGERDSLVDRLWQGCTGVLLVVEAGTPAGFAIVRKARNLLLEAGAQTIAPCPHDFPCPLPSGDWCHFGQRLPRQEFHRLAKQVELPYEDEKFSYAAM